MCPGTATSGYGSCPRRSLLDQRNGSCTFKRHASYTLQSPGTVTPASQLCDKASRHCGLIKQSLSNTHQKSPAIWKHTNLYTLGEGPGPNSSSVNPEDGFNVKKELVHNWSYLEMFLTWRLFSFSESFLNQANTHRAKSRPSDRGFQKGIISMNFPTTTRHDQ